MAKEDTKDGLFGTNLGDGLIDIPDTVEETAAVVPAVVPDTTAIVPAKDEAEKENFKQYEDGTIEIDEQLQATIDAGRTATEGDEANIEKTEKEKEKAPSGSGQGDSSPSSSQYLAFAQDRAKEGVFLDFNDEDWKVLVERNDGNEALALRELSAISVQEMVKRSVEDFKGSITDDDRALYEAKEKGLPIDAYGKAKHEFNKWNAVKPEDIKENVKLQVDIVSKGLEIRGYSKDEIIEEIEGYKALENLEAKAEKILPLLPKKFGTEVTDLEEGAAAEDLSRKDKVRQGVVKMKQMVDNTVEIIPGIKLNKPAKEKILKSMTEPVARDVEGNPLNPVMLTRTKNPQGFEMMIHYYHQLGLFNIDEDGQMKPDFSKIAKVSKNETVDAMRNIFESKEKQVAGRTKTIKTKADELDDFDKAFSRI